MGQAFYRKYRSKTFDEVIGQEHVTATLRNALKSGRISHAYLFTGPKGVGKTSVARILAHEVNKLPYTEDSVHLDIIEIDAASNRRIDEIRDLRERVHTAPTSAKYKVYIIDEVHMLTREAFNALLKTLEEPPEHCIFILATTEAHKLPDTIVSRTQRYTFKPVDGSGAAEHLKNIAKQEKINIEEEAVNLIARHGDGSFRDSIGILDQISSLDSKITTDSVRQFLGLPSDEAIDGIMAAIAEGDSPEVLTILTELKGQGKSAPKVAGSLAQITRSRLIDGDRSLWIPFLLRELLLVPVSPSPYDQLEISLLEASSMQSSKEQSKDKPAIKDEIPNIPKEKITDKKSETSASTDTQTSKNTNDFALSMWPEVTERVKAEAASIYTALRLASPSYDAGLLTLSFQFPLHQKKISQAKNLDIVGRVIEELCGSKIIIRCIIDKDALPVAHETGIEEPSLAVKAAGRSPVNSISDIFGGAEVLES